MPVTGHKVQAFKVGRWLERWCSIHIAFVPFCTHIVFHLLLPTVFSFKLSRFGSASFLNDGVSAATMS